MWPSCDGLPNGPFRASTPCWEMVHLDKLTGPNSGTSKLLALSKCQNMNVNLLEHLRCSMLNWKLQVSRGALSFACDFKKSRLRLKSGR